MALTPTELVDRLAEANAAIEERRARPWPMPDPLEFDARAATIALELHLKPGNSAVVGSRVVTCTNGGGIHITNLVEL